MREALDGARATGGQVVPQDCHEREDLLRDLQSAGIEPIDRYHGYRLTSGGETFDVAITVAVG